LYGYVLSDPINFVDPSGEAAFWYHFVDGVRVGNRIGKGLVGSLRLGVATMSPDFNRLKNLPEAHATSFDPRTTPQEAINNSLSMASNQWKLGTIESQGIAIHIWRDVVSHSGSYFPVNASITDYIKHIMKYDLLPGGSFADVIELRIKREEETCK
jgi:hypothetical protein